MSKVYCKNCKFFKKSLNEFLPDYCNAPELGITKNYIYGDYKTVKYVTEKDYPNKADVGDCTFYKVKSRLWRKLLFISEITARNSAS